MKKDIKQNIKKLSGSFQIGCGIMVKDENYNIYHLIVVEDRATKKACIELHNNIYFEEEVIK